MPRIESPQSAELSTKTNTSAKKVNRLRLILGDQLNARHSWYRKPCDQTLYLIAELKQETGYVKHHVQKVCAFFLAMENFAQALEQAGHQVLHLTLDQTCEHPSLPSLIAALVKQYGITSFEYQRPDEYRLLDQLSAIRANPKSIQSPNLEVNEYDTEHFLLAFEDIPKQFKAGKAHRMEAFYRRMRKQHQILMKEGEPAGGKWNYDQENRQSFKKADLDDIPDPLVFSNDIGAILERINRHQISYFGHTDTHISWPCNRRQALDLLSDFLERQLPKFGVFQDAMTDQSPHSWSLYHSRLSFAINSKMLSPERVIRQSLDYCEARPGHASLAQLEGFIRQILGWREYIRGMYWANMPDYQKKNALNAMNPLPSWFWSGDTTMNCLKQSITQSLDYAYAHHIQRLMIIGNFALLAGLNPDELDAWYLGIYIDAIEWVEMPNTRGMSQFADGGLIASKPYAASANYINKMSDYCKTCRYDPKLKTGENACPYNALYWDFLLRHQETMRNNPRMAFPYKQLEKMSEAQTEAIQHHAATLIETLNQL